MKMQPRATEESEEQDDEADEAEGEPMGEETERELSLSREDDSDLSVVSDYNAEEELKYGNNNLAAAQDNNHVNNRNVVNLHNSNLMVAAAAGVNRR